MGQMEPQVDEPLGISHLLSSESQAGGVSASLPSVGEGHLYEKEKFVQNYGE